jgi:hypothetical protein
MSDEPTGPRAHVLTLDTMEDANGNRLADQVTEKFMQAEDWLQSYMDRNGEEPEKPVEITVKIQVKAEDRRLRRVYWQSSLKTPVESKQYGQFAVSADGVMTCNPPARQARMDFSRPTPVEALREAVAEEAGSE